MNALTRTALFLGLLHSTFGHAQPALSQMPQGTPPRINDKAVQTIQNSFKANAKPAAASAPSAASSTTASAPQNLATRHYQIGNAPANNVDNQAAYQAKIKQQLKAQK